MPELPSASDPHIPTSRCAAADRSYRELYDLGVRLGAKHPGSSQRKRGTGNPALSAFIT